MRTAEKIDAAVAERITGEYQATDDQETAIAELAAIIGPQRRLHVYDPVSNPLTGELWITAYTDPALFSSDDVLQGRNHDDDTRIVMQRDGTYRISCIGGAV